MAPRIYLFFVCTVCALISLGCGQAYETKYANLRTTKADTRIPVTPSTEENNTNIANNPIILDTNAPCYLPLSYLEDNIRGLIQSACKLTNAERERAGLPPVFLELTHSSVAQAHAEDMVFNNFFGHKGSDGNGFRERLIAENVEFYYGGENIAYGILTGLEVVNLWMSSGPHRQNIVNANHTKMGIGYYDTYWVQVFTD